ncbi:hypothetical protein BOTCAL_0451g00060 [Botryotinia calthae]|uniref:Uncharacterized protein n=1 Tax=Botryotinia calthae TaxID=38488 RepID=A0A4Y8CQU2_9HELO|nr:hypothetical protein BOTCAL_0451g00060 [Botryotinia calthae]
MGAQVIPPDSTSTALVVSKPRNKNGPRVKDLISKFEKLGKEVIDLCGRKHEENIQRALPKWQTAFTDYISSKFSEIQGINAELGLDLPLEKPREIFAVYVDENNQKFITVERERNAIQKEHLMRIFDEFNFEVFTVLEISATETTPSFVQLIENPDDAVDAVDTGKPVEDNRSLKKALEYSKKTLAELEAEQKLEKTTIARSQTFYHEVRQENATLKDELKLLREQNQYYKVVANSCSRVRHGLYHSGRRIYHNRGFHNIEGRALAVREVNDLRNDACHKGDIATDCALYMIDPNRAGWNNGGERYLDFTIHDPDLVLLNILNLHATMHRCYSNTKYSHCEANDEDFNQFFAKIFAKYKDLLASTNFSQAVKRYEDLVSFIKQAVYDRMAMEEIVRETVAYEKARNFSRA